MLAQFVLLCAVALGAVEIGASREDSSEWWTNSFIYQIYPRSFKDSDGDGVGDLNGIISKLEHVADLGASGFWVSPFYPSPNVDFGYDVSNFTDVDPLFGTLSDFDALVAKAHSLGLKVIIDFVPNHTSDQHPWFKKSVQRIKPYDGYYIWNDGKVVDGERQPPNNWLSAFGGSAWEWNSERGQYYLHQFAAGQPDLDYRSLAVENEMKDVLRFWLNRGVNGFRIDAVNHMYEDERFLDEPVIPDTGLPATDYDTLEHIYTKNLNETYFMVRKWRDLCDDEVSNRVKTILFTEIYGSNEDVMKYYHYGSNVPFNFMFMGALNKYSRNSDFKRVIDEWLTQMPKGQSANWVIGNHDQRRVTERFGVERADEITMLAAVLPGVGIAYNGDEIGMEDVWLSYEDTVDPSGCNAGPDRYQYKSRDPQRTPFQWDNTTSAGFSTNNHTWLPVHSNYKTLNLADQKHQPVSHYSVFKQLVALKKQSIMLHGSTETIALGDSILAVVRRLDNDLVVLIINFSESNVVFNANRSLNIPSELVVYTASVDSGILPGSGMSTSALNVPGAASIVLSFKK